MKVEAVIDRITEHGQAVVLAETIEREFFIERKELPEGAERGDYLNLELDEDEIRSIEIDEKKTKERKSAVKSKLEQLRQRQTGSRFRKK